ncbi:hypothetical protein N8I77_004313 [Diaporthe amygdali]|uniref:Uncharacterized protein n=1 Tax=Phomopsis amygdali TaxID=1214568 RepID=A0AAD9SLP9_PHOAM|nr:hypothetical protein N8I77_004313 [Diaporthe amygdali]
MGVCASCLGGQPRDPVDQDDEVESGPLLFSVPNGMHYGSFAEPQMAMAPHSDSLDAQRETEALQRVVARTSDKMIDVYSAPNADRRHKHGGVRDRQAQYQSLLYRVGSDETWATDDGSLSMDEEDDAQSHGEFTHITVDPRRKLVGSFREAAAAMA